MKVVAMVVYVLREERQGGQQVDLFGLHKHLLPHREKCFIPIIESGMCF